MIDHKIDKSGRLKKFDRSGKVNATHKVGKDLWQALIF